MMGEGGSKKIRNGLSGPQDEFINNEEREFMALRDEEVSYR